MSVLFVYSLSFVTQVVGKFIARAVADDCLPPKYIMKYRGEETEEDCPHTKYGYSIMIFSNTIRHYLLSPPLWLFAKSLNELPELLVAMLNLK